jgi:hypothetical protein
VKFLQQVDCAQFCNKILSRIILSDPIYAVLCSIGVKGLFQPALVILFRKFRSTSDHIQLMLSSLYSSILEWPGISISVLVAVSAVLVVVIAKPFSSKKQTKENKKSLDSTSSKIKNTISSEKEPIIEERNILEEISKDEPIEQIKVEEQCDNELDLKMTDVAPVSIVESPSTPTIEVTEVVDDSKEPDSVITSNSYSELTDQDTISDEASDLLTDGI